MSTSVSNPYTFNIQSSTTFSTSVTAGVTFQINMKYVDAGSENSWVTSLTAVNLPLTIGEYTLARVWTGSETEWGEHTDSSTTVEFSSRIPKTHIIINGGPFYNVALTRSYYSDNLTAYESSENYESSNWDNVPFELSIKFMD